MEIEHKKYQNMAKNMELTYLHFRILKFPLNISQMLHGAGIFTYKTGSFLGL